jgi:hypothetical protein
MTKLEYYKYFIYLFAFLMLLHGGDIELHIFYHLNVEKSAETTLSKQGLRPRTIFL